MKNSIATNNMNILENLKPYEKLTVDSDMNISVDTRYIQFLRRAVTRDSRNDLLDPIAYTFGYKRCVKFVEVGDKTIEIEYVEALNTTLIPNETKILVLNHLKTILKETYPDFLAIFELLEKLHIAVTNEISETTLKKTGQSVSAFLDLKSHQFEMEEKEKEEKAMKEKEEKARKVKEEKERKEKEEKAIKEKEERERQRKEKEESNPLVNALLKKDDGTQKMINWRSTLLSISEELADFLGVNKTSKMSSKEIELSLHKYILNHDLFSRETKKITADVHLAKLCRIPVDSIFTNDLLKVYVFSNHVSHR